MSPSFKVLIPARYESTRLPGKPLETIGGKPLIQHIYDAASLSLAEQVVILTDDHRIRVVAEGFGASVLMTSSDHGSGTERIVEAVRLAAEDETTIIVNVQGDEYALPPSLVDQVATMLHRHADAHMASLYERITSTRELHDPNVVKVVFDQSQRALYFSRSPVPYRRPEEVSAQNGFGCLAYRHIGLYAYRAGFLKQYAGLPVSDMERSERLEQLRGLYAGFHIQLEEAVAGGGIGIDTPADLERARTLHDRRHQGD